MSAFFNEFGVDFRDSRGQTPLNWAIANGNLKQLGSLLEKGVDVTAEDKNGKPAYDIA